MKRALCIGQLIGVSGDYFFGIGVYMENIYIGRFGYIRY